MGENNTERAKADAEALLEQLSGVYKSYVESSEPKGRSLKGFARLFKKWISYNAEAVEPLNQEFLDNVERITSGLAAALEQLIKSDPELCSAYAAKAADIMLSPKPSREKTTAEWYLTVAEYKSACLLPYLAKGDLKRIRDAQLKATPKRLMYPKQRELFELMEKLLSEK
ncbi:MAG: hypothetical protein ACM3S4_12265 [Burkholderiales bacterium]